MFLIYELFLGLSRGEETFDFGKCYGFTHDHPWMKRDSSVADLLQSLSGEPKLPHSVTFSAAKVYRAGPRDASWSLP